jgi:phosphoenolpyruvate carboxylase
VLSRVWWVSVTGCRVHVVRLLSELAGRRPLFPPGIDLSPDEAEVVNTFWCACARATAECLC